jgi:hypothetical protein
MRRFCVEPPPLANPKKVANYVYAGGEKNQAAHEGTFPKAQLQKMAEREGFEPSLRFNP